MGKQNLSIGVRDIWKKGDIDYDSFIKALVYVFDDWLEGEGERAGAVDGDHVSQVASPKSKYNNARSCGLWASSQDMCACPGMKTHGATEVL